MPDTTVTEPLTPLTPDAVISAFRYLHAVQADAPEAAAGVLAAEARMPALLVDVATRIVVPVTALPDPDTETACEDTFALEALGRVFLNTLRTWEQTGPDAAAGIARAVIDFTAEILTEDHETVADILHHLQAVALGQALAAHPGLPSAAHHRPAPVGPALRQRGPHHPLTTVTTPPPVSPFAP